MISIWGVSDKGKPTAHCDSIEEATRTALLADEGDYSVYFGVGLRKPGLSVNSRGGADDVIALPGLFADIDYGTTGHASTDCPPTLEAALDIVDAAGIEPTIVVNSGGGIHVYQLSTSPIPTRTKEEQRRATRLLKEFQDKLQKAAVAKGYHVDGGQHSIDRVLRVPGTTNRKAGTSRPVEVLLSDGPRLCLDEAGPEYVKRKLSGITGDLRLIAESIVHGTPFSKPGSRDTDFARICFTIGRMDYTTPAEELAEIFRPCIQATIDRDGDWDEDEIIDVVADKIDRGQEKAAEEAANRAELDAAIIPEKKEPPPGTPPDDQLIIYKGEAHYVWTQGRYQTPVLGKELEDSLKRDWRDMDDRIQWEKIQNMKRRYSTVARTVVADLNLADSYYDISSQTFNEAVAPRRVLEPLYVPEIEKWLTLMAGDLAPKLLAWTATIGRLDRYSSALYISGGSGIGKSLYVHGLARRWRSSATELHRIIDSNFNEELCRCPLVYADEELPAGRQGKPTTAKIRELVTSTRRTLSRKFLPPADLVGALRIIVVANNENVLSVGQEDLTPDDLDAFGRRFLHIRAQPEAAEYLRELGGQKNVNAFIEDNLLARYSLWLELNLDFEHGERFLVEGETQQLKMLLATKGKWTALACEWLARHLSQPKQSVKAAKNVPEIKIGNGEILVNAVTLVDQWEAYLPGQAYKAPSVQLLSKSLKHVSKTTKTLEGQKYHSIDVSLFLSWCEEAQIGNVEKMRMAIVNPLVNG